jgi:hypothetical protein
MPHVRLVWRGWKVPTAEPLELPAEVARAKLNHLPIRLAQVIYNSIPIFA